MANVRCEDVTNRFDYLNNYFLECNLKEELLWNFQISSNVAKVLENIYRNELRRKNFSSAWNRHDSRHRQITGNLGNSWL